MKAVFALIASLIGLSTARVAPPPELPDTKDLDEISNNNCRSNLRESVCAQTCGLTECFDTSSIDGAQYPGGGMCTIYNNTHPATATPYTVSGIICQYQPDYPQGTGIIFNFQDVNNYDMVFKRDQTDTSCTIGYLENRAIFETTTFACPATVVENTHTFTAVVTNGQADVTLTLQDGTEASSGPFTPHFTLRSAGGVLLVNEAEYQYIEFNGIFLEEGDVTTPTTPSTTTTVSGDPCDSAPCQNGGTCTNNGGTPVCTCPPAYTGTVCDIPVTGGCDSSPCLNGGSCVDDEGANGYICRCPPKQYGPQCNAPVTPLEFQIRLDAFFNSIDGTTFPSECQTQYASAMEEKCLEMVGFTNGQIGDVVCAGDTEDDVIIGSTASFLLAPSSGSRGQTSNRFISSLGDDQTFDDVLACQTELCTYLQPYPTWGEPQLPQIPGCPDLDFESDAYNCTAQEWICIDQLGHHGMRVDNQIGYEVDMTGNWQTVNGEVLGFECAVAYDIELTDQAFDALAATNAVIGTELCVGIPGMTLESVSKEFSPIDNTGQIKANYFISIETPMLISDAYICAREISDHIRKFTTWGEPLLPTQPTCPGLDFDGTELTETNQRWACTAN